MIAKANQNKINPTTLSNETGLNEEALVTLLRNSYELQQQETQEEEEEEEEEQDEEEEEEQQPKAKQNTIANEEIRECPMCYWEFPKHFTLENKKEHIEKHFA
jgi:DNA-binding protein H-NS